MAAENFKVNGLGRLVKRIENLDPKKKITVLRRAGREALQPVLKDMQNNVRRDQDDLYNSLTITTRVGARRNKSRLMLFKVGPLKKATGRGADRRSLGRINAKALSQEYGNVRQKAKPFVRPAMERHKRLVLARIIKAVDKEWKKVVK